MRVKEKRFANKSFEIIYLSVVFIGLLTATAFVVMNSLTENLSSFQNLTLNTKNEFFSLLFKAFLKNNVTLLVVFACGFSAVFQPVIFVCGFAKGISIAVMILSAFEIYGAKGVGIVFLKVIMPCAFSVYALVIGARESFYLSCNLANGIFSKNTVLELKNASKLYIIKFLILEIFVVVGCLLECIIKILV